MGKKRSRDADGQGDVDMADPAVTKRDDDDSSDDEDMDIVNVDFELFNYDSQIDFHGVKTLLRQLFDTDAQLFNLSAISDLIIEQNTIGSTCKVDDKANDAYAFLTVLNLQEHRAKQPVAQLIEYLTERAKSNDSLAGVLPELLASGKHVGLVLAERLLNMPAEVIPPMWTCMIDEIEAAVEDKEPYEFSHYLVVSRTYREVASSLDQSERKQKKAREEAELQFFHPEDDEMRKHAVASGAYDFTKEGEAVADSKRAFQEMGIKPCGFMMLIEASKFQGAVQAIAEYIGTAT
ncbi:p21-C-terminal region-binding protein-domain-containing protein [Chaetomium tenue]|uniref:P21-C-terminal region-binding protein-domain-containing protein n=1 Tax=Chaetomium tenue TaxID=1854479 RepID=A0ACB7PCU1_9PEZI|nr:p21-C-terminal region-binding protein-domain-containing protein [Chaetomium globosum]